MFGAEIRSMLIEVITSWQVLVITVIIVFYFFLVSYASKTHQPRPRKAHMPRKKKAEKPASPAPDGTDELGLEEPS